MSTGGSTEVIGHDHRGALISEISRAVRLNSGFDLLGGESQKSDEAEQDQDFFHAETLDDRRDGPAFGTILQVGRSGRFATPAD